MGGCTCKFNDICLSELVNLPCCFMWCYFQNLFKTPNSYLTFSQNVQLAFLWCIHIIM